MAVTTNLGRVQGGGFYGSTSTSETSIPKSSVSAGSVAPLTSDVIVNANGDLCRITAVTSTAYTVSKFGSIKGATGEQGPQGETGDGLPAGGTAGQFIKKTADGTAWGDIARDVNIIGEVYVSFVLPLINLDSESENKIVSGRLVLWRSNNVFAPSFLDISAYQWYKGEDGSTKDGTIVIESSMLGGIKVRGVKFSYNNQWWLGLDFYEVAANLTNAKFYGIAVNAFDPSWGAVAYKNNNTGEVLNSEVNTNLLQKAAVNEQSHPVNSLYMSTNSTDPAQLFGGTWEQLTGDAYLKIVTNNQGDYAGTSSSHQIPLTSMPGHKHNVAFEGGDYDGYSLSLFGGVQNPNNIGILQSAFTVGVMGHSGPLHTLETGGSQAYYPYYYGVYVWRRVA